MWQRIRRFTRNYRWTIVIVIGCILWNALGWLAWHRHRTASYAFGRVKEAIQKRDLELFESYVDVAKVAEGFCDQHLLMAQDEGHLRSRCVATTAHRFRRWITTRRIDEHEKPRLALLGSVLGGAFDGGYVHIRSLHAAGSSALATVDVLDRAQRGATFEILLLRFTGEWRVVDVTNVQAVFNALIAGEQARVLRLQQRIARSVQFGDPQLQPDDPQRPNQKFYRIEFTSRDAAEAWWSVLCSSAEGSGESKGQRLDFRDNRRRTIAIVCECKDPCRPPRVTIDEVRLDDGRGFTVQAMPLD